MGFEIRDDGIVCQPSTSPPLTGTLRLCFRLWNEPTTRQLLDLPNGVRFRRLEGMWYRADDLRCFGAAVEVCSDTLECVGIQCGDLGKFYSFGFFNGLVIASCLPPH